MTQTTQERFDQQAMDSLKSRMPDGAVILGSVVTLPVSAGCSPEDLAVGYIRVSKGREKMISPEIQWDSIVEHCARKRLVLHRVFMDMHRSGRAFERRAVQTIVDEVQAGQYQQVVLWKWSRWGRNQRWSQVYLAGVEDSGGRVWSATEDVDPTTPIGKYTRTTFLALAELESDQKSEGWKETQNDRRSRDLPHSGNPRFGYRYVNGSYQIDPATGPVLIQCYKDFVAGTTVAALTKRLVSLDVLTVANKPMNPSTLARTLDTGFAAGLIREQSKPPEGAAQLKSSLRVFDVWRRGAHEPLIDNDLWEAYVERRQATRMKQRAPRRLHALSGLLVHADCMGPMSSAFSGRHNYHSWRCTWAIHHHERCAAGTSIRNTIVMDALWEWLEKEAEGGEDFDHRVTEQNRRNDLDSEKETLQSSADKLRRRLHRLLDLYENEEVDRDEYRLRKAAREQELRTIEARMTELRRVTAVVIDANYVERLRGAWDDSDAQGQQEALRKIIQRIEISNAKRVGCRGDATRVRIVPRWTQ